MRNSLIFRMLLLMLTDLAVFCIILMSVCYGYRALGWGIYEPSRYTMLLLFSPVFLGINILSKLYYGNILQPGAPLNEVEEIRRLFYSISGTYLLLSSLLLLTRMGEYFSRAVLLISWLLSFLLLPICREIVRSWCCRAFGRIRVLIAGAGKTGHTIEHMLRNDTHFGFETVGFLDDGPNEQSTPPVLGKLNQISTIAKTFGVDYLILCLPPEKLISVIKRHFRHFKHVMVIPDNQVFPISWTTPVVFYHFAGLEINNQLLISGQRGLKIFFEVLFSGLAILLLSPLFLVLMIAVKLSSQGSAFYGARRIGYRGKKITVYKFRTMYRNADRKLERLLAENPHLENEWRKRFKLHDDPRITRLGKFLRRTSLDELPQLWNVLKGEMALIGPRPIVAAEKGLYGRNYRIFFLVKPGITGLWQSSGRSDLDYESRVRLDLFYVLNWSLWLDWNILLRTIREVLFERGAR